MKTQTNKQEKQVSKLELFIVASFLFLAAIFALNLLNYLILSL